MTDLVAERLEMLLARLRGSYESIGHSSGRPYIYFIYEPGQERSVQRVVDDRLRSDDSLCFHRIDMLSLTIAATHGQEDVRREMLLDPRKPDAAAGIVGHWVRRLTRTAEEALAHPESTGRPVFVLSGLAALHPLTNPTALMEQIAERELRDPVTNRIVPMVLLVPGVQPAGASRQYRFLGLEEQTLSFYRGEEL
jgi:hypothetical protein